MNGERMLHSAVQHREERSFENTVIAKPSINYQRQAVTPVPMATGSPMDCALFLKLLPFTAVHCICFPQEVAAGSLQMNPSCPHSGWSRDQQAGLGKVRLCNFVLNALEGQ